MSPRIDRFVGAVLILGGVMQVPAEGRQFCCANILACLDERAGELSLLREGGECRADSVALAGPQGPLPVQLSQIESWPGTEWVKSARLSFIADLAPLAPTSIS